MPWLYSPSDSSDSDVRSAFDDDAPFIVGGLWEFRNDPNGPLPILLDTPLNHYSQITINETNGVDWRRRVLDSHGDELGSEYIRHVEQRSLTNEFIQHWRARGQANGPSVLTNGHAPASRRASPIRDDIVNLGRPLDARFQDHAIVQDPNAPFAVPDIEEVPDIPRRRMRFQDLSGRNHEVTLDEDVTIASRGAATRGGARRGAAGPGAVIRGAAGRGAIGRGGAGGRGGGRGRGRP